MKIVNLIFLDDLSVPTTSWYDDEVSINEQFLSEVKHPINTIQNNGKVVIVKNISPHVTRKQLISFFSKFGKVFLKPHCHILFMINCVFFFSICFNFERIFL